MELFAPLSGGGIGIWAWIERLAPVISIIAAVTGIILGVLSYSLKRRQQRVEEEYLKVKIERFRHEQNN